MLLPSIFGENLFDDFFDDVPFFDNRAENQIEDRRCQGTDPQRFQQPRRGRTV